MKEKDEVLYLLSRFAEPSHFDGSGSGSLKTGTGSSGSDLEKVKFLFYEHNFKILRVFVCINLGL